MTGKAITGVCRAVPCTGGVDDVMPDGTPAVGFLGYDADNRSNSVRVVFSRAEFVRMAALFVADEVALLTRGAA